MRARRARQWWAAASSRPFSWRTPPAHHARTHPQHSSRASSRTYPFPATSAIPTSSCRHQCSPILRFFPFSSSTFPSNTTDHGSLRLDAIRQLPSTTSDLRLPPPPSAGHGRLSSMKASPRRALPDSHSHRHGASPAPTAVPSALASPPSQHPPAPAVAYAAPHCQ